MRRLMLAGLPLLAVASLAAWQNPPASTPGAEYSPLGVSDLRAFEHA